MYMCVRARLCACVVCMRACVCVCVVKIMFHEDILYISYIG